MLAVAHHVEVVPKGTFVTLACFRVDLVAVGDGLLSLPHHASTVLLIEPCEAGGAASVGLTEGFAGGVDGLALAALTGEVTEGALNAGVAFKLVAVGVK